ncbi:TauD/TfdA dioxygenase family protein [Burkholderia gladioli]|uniref:TauD/TfdA dioxygenase family protein n=1 Tax=Burkholderia gladioli TaxID=28095 RepID=UPI0022CF3533|nr:TauD/TfdA family dioxygenase [Burkholderia gladioli]MDA0574072.1 TauD/TfdA family dioxygenase [Burkholderia gladioli]MDA0602359.1 TauD/TfdA family dioxygenase [Burkholderia gladioli]
MNQTAIYPRKADRLTASGIGLTLQTEEFLAMEPQALRDLLKIEGFVVVPGLNLDKPEFSELYRRYGHPVEYSGHRANVGYGYGDMLELNGDRNKIVTGRGRLPFHTDGGILRSNVDQIFLYAAEIQNLRFSGATLVTDHVAALRDMPPHLRRVLEHDRFEVRAAEPGYYSGASPEGWFEIDTFRDYGWVRALMIYFPFDNGDPPSWETRIAGFSAFETRKFFDELGRYLRRDRYTYSHYWTRGDLLISDNRRTLHEREPFREESSRRVLWRGQTSESPVVFTENERLLG